MKSAAIMIVVLAGVEVAAAQQPASGASDTVAATVGVQRISIAEVDALLGAKLLKIRAEEYSLRRKAVDELIEDRLFAEEARRRGVSLQALLKDNGIPLDAKGLEAQMSDEEVDSVIRAFPERYQAMETRAAAFDVRRKLAGERMQMRRRQFANSLRRQYAVVVNLKPPRVDVRTQDRPVLGPNAAPVSIVVFSDFQCPYCAKLAVVLRSVVDEHPGKVRVVFKDFPLPSHKEARPAARAGMCADEQGRFWPFHDSLFARQQELSAPTIRAAAAAVGIEMNAFESCLQTAKAGLRQEEDLEEGMRLGVPGTPTLFVNGRMVPAAREALEAVIKEEMEILAVSATVARKD